MNRVRGKKEPAISCFEGANCLPEYRPAHAVRPTCEGGKMIENRTIKEDEANQEGLNFVLS